MKVYQQKVISGANMLGVPGEMEEYDVVFRREGD